MHRVTFSADTRSFVNFFFNEQIQIQNLEEDPDDDYDQRWRWLTKMMKLKWWLWTKMMIVNKDDDDYETHIMNKDVKPRSKIGPDAKSRSKINFRWNT